MNILKTSLIASLLALTLPVLAQTTNSASANAMTMGSVVKINTEQQKVTVKHEAITNLDMPGMTMVFRVKDAAMLTAVKPGNDIQFRAEKVDGAITITHLEVAK